MPLCVLFLHAYPSSASDNDCFGFNVQLDDDANHLVVSSLRYWNDTVSANYGQMSRVTVVYRGDDTWATQQDLTHSLGPYSGLGISLAVSGNGSVVAAGAPMYNNSQGRS